MGNKCTEFFAKGVPNGILVGRPNEFADDIFPVKGGEVRYNIINERFAKYPAFHFMESMTYSNTFLEQIMKDPKLMAKYLGKLDKREYHYVSEPYCPVIKIPAWQYHEGIKNFAGHISAYVFDVNLFDIEYFISAHCELDLHRAVLGEKYAARKIDRSSFALVFPWICLHEQEEDMDCSPAVAARDLKKWFKFWTTKPPKRPPLPDQKIGLEDIVLLPNTTLFDMAEQKIIGTIAEFVGKGSK